MVAIQVTQVCYMGQRAKTIRNLLAEKERKHGRQNMQLILEFPFVNKTFVVHCLVRWIAYGLHLLNRLYLMQSKSAPVGIKAEKMCGGCVLCRDRQFYGMRPKENKRA